MPQDQDGATTPRPDHLFKPGHVPANKGRTGQRNARQRLASVVFGDAVEHWDEHGPGALRRLAFHDPAAYVAFIAKLVPQRVEHETVTPFDGVDEALLAVSLRISKAIVFLPAEDREMLEMLLDKAEGIATSQKNLQAELPEEGVGGQSSGKIFRGEGTPHPQNPKSPNLLIDGPAVAASATREGGLKSEAAARVDGENVIDADFDEEADR